MPGVEGDWTFGISEHNIQGQYPEGYFDGKKVSCSPGLLFARLALTLLSCAHSTTHQMRLTWRAVPTTRGVWRR